MYPGVRAEHKRKTVMHTKERKTHSKTFALNGSKLNNRGQVKHIKFFTELRK